MEFKLDQQNTHTNHTNHTNHTDQANVRLKKSKNDIICVSEKKLCIFCGEKMVLPMYFSCEQKCCMKCFFHNKDAIAESRKCCCVTCKNYDHLFTTNSPIFNLPPTVTNSNIEDIYELFCGGKLCSANKNDLEGKQICITKDDENKEKGYFFKQTLIGECQNSNSEEYTLKNSFVIDRNKMEIYYTYPSLRTYKHNPIDCLFYIE